MINLKNNITLNNINYKKNINLLKDNIHHHLY